jgi:hypothetical protein
MNQKIINFDVKKLCPAKKLLVLSAESYATVTVRPEGRQLVASFRSAIQELSLAALFAGVPIALLGRILDVLSYESTVL